MLNRFFESREEICQFLDSKGKDITSRRNEKWWCDQAFLCNIRKHIIALNLQPQGRGCVITDTVRAFKAMPRLWATQMQQGNFSHFPCCQTLTGYVSTTLPSTQIADKLAALGTEFTRWFTNFAVQKFPFELLRIPFAVDVERAPVNLQMELVDLQCYNALRVWLCGRCTVS